MSPRRFPLPFLSAVFLLTFITGACSSGGGSTNGTPNPTPGGGANSVGGTPAAAGTNNPAAGATMVIPGAGAGGSPATAGSSGSGGTTPIAGTAPVAGSGGATGGSAGAAGASGASGAAGAGGMSSGMRTAGCGMIPGGTDSATTFIKHDIEVTGVDPAFVTKYPPNANTTYNWTHRNYFVRLPTNYNPATAYPVTIGSSGCGGPETVGSEGGYAPLGVAAGETQAIQVSLSYVLASSANVDCGGAVFADNFPNTPEVQYLAAVVKDVQSKYCTDSSKVFLGGYSSGAFESITLGCANSDILRGYGVQIGGGLRDNGPKPCKGPVAAFFVVGLQDTENPIDARPAVHSLGTAAARDEVLMRNGCTDITSHKPWDANYPMCESYGTCPAKYPVVWCAITSGHLPDAKDPAVGKYRYDGLWKFWSTLP